MHSISSKRYNKCTFLLDMTYCNMYIIPKETMELRAVDFDKEEQKQII